MSLFSANLPARRHGLALALGAILCLAAPAAAAVPGQVSYQSLLLDPNGLPVNGSVDLAFRLFDALTGGTVVWTETIPGVFVLDGVYQATLGAATPLSPSLISSGPLFLEVQVDAETLAPRQPLLAVPFAIRAGSAESAETVNGLAGEYIQQFIEFVDGDGADPPNMDPREGLTDTDGDGRANFVDSDNDDDGFSDSAELAQGSDLNLITPAISGFSPLTAVAFGTTRVTVSGTGFEPGQAVVFGAQTPAPLGLTATSFDVDVGPQPVGTVSVAVSRLNGETSPAASFDFNEPQPAIASVFPAWAGTGEIATLTVTGSNFASLS